MKQQRFIPTTGCGLQVREPQDGQQDSRHISGRPIVFGVRSNNLTPWSTTREVYEVLEPGCISSEVLQKSDIVLNTNHRNDISCILGRYRNSEKDTLRLVLRADGVDCDCELPKTTTADDTLELIRRGDIDGMSFAFEDDYEDTENGVSYERTDETHDGKEVWLRHVKRITALYDVSVVTHPAYDAATVATREESDRINEAIDAQIAAQEREEPATEEETADDVETILPEEPTEAQGETIVEEPEQASADESEEPADDTDNNEEEQRQREAAAVARMRKKRANLRNREIDNTIIY